MSNLAEVSFREYLPTGRQAMWWIAGGILWAAVTLPLVLYPPAREGLRVAGSGGSIVLALTPLVWAMSLLSVLWPGILQSSSGLPPSIALAVLFGGAEGYALGVSFTMLVKAVAAFMSPE